MTSVYLCEGVETHMEIYIYGKYNLKAVGKLRYLLHTEVFADPGKETSWARCLQVSILEMF